MSISASGAKRLRASHTVGDALGDTGVAAARVWGSNPICASQLRTSAAPTER